MALRVYDTLRRKKFLFRPISKDAVMMFVCGPTVYDNTHIGHAKTYISSDIIARWVRRSGYRLKLIVNVTDVEDKIIRRAAEEGIRPSELAGRYEAQFMDYMKRLGISHVDLYPRASEHITEMQGQITRLLENGSAYITGTGIYYDITKFNDYGKLSGQNPEEPTRHRIEPDPTKRNQHDFSIWKRAPPHSDPSWEYEATLAVDEAAAKYIMGEGAETAAKLVGGKIKLSMWGRPGWHIEDTAIAEQYLGVQYDLHGGGLDLIFPHHECEIAQMESVSGKRPMVKYWVHTGLLTVNGKKMSKSLKNYTTVGELLERHSGEALRMAFINLHYRSPMDFNPALMAQAESQLERLYNSLDVLGRAKEPDKDDEGFEDEIKGAEAGFKKAMDDDFNTPGALKAMFDISSAINRHAQSGITKAQKSAAKRALAGMADVLGILTGEGRGAKMPEGAVALVAERERLRKAGNYKEADRIRKELADMGVSVEDTPDGPVARTAR